jgi:hypothetical protein
LLSAESAEGRLVFSNEALSERDIRGAPFAARPTDELGTEAADIVIIEGVPRLEIGDDLLHELFADLATCHGRRVNAARYEMQSSLDKIRALALPFCPCPSRRS